MVSGGGGGGRRGLEVSRRSGGITNCPFPVHKLVLFSCIPDFKKLKSI